MKANAATALAKATVLRKDHQATAAKPTAAKTAKTAVLAKAKTTGRAHSKDSRKKETRRTGTAPMSFQNLVRAERQTAQTRTEVTSRGPRI
jgi:hypothetical protein